MPWARAGSPGKSCRPVNGGLTIPRTLPWRRRRCTAAGPARGAAHARRREASTARSHGAAARGRAAGGRLHASRQRDVQPAATSRSPPATAGVGGIDALLVLQGEEDPAQRRRRTANRGRRHPGLARRAEGRDPRRPYPGRRPAAHLRRCSTSGATCRTIPASTRSSPTSSFAPAVGTRQARRAEARRSREPGRHSPYFVCALISCAPCAETASAFKFDSYVTVRSPLPPHAVHRYSPRRPGGPWTKVAHGCKS